MRTDDIVGDEKDDLLADEDGMPEDDKVEQQMEMN